MAVHLTRIYTRTGDDGTTALGDMSRVAKTDPRVVAYADCDETNAALGAALALGQLPASIVAVLTTIQNDLFDVGADLCTPVVPDPKYPPLRVESFYVERLEAWCDEFDEQVGKLDSFILPGGTPAPPCCTRPARWPAEPSAAPGPCTRPTPSTPTGRPCST